jgi:hypothetical protein
MNQSDLEALIECNEANVSSACRRRGNKWDRKEESKE